MSCLAVALLRSNAKRFALALGAGLGFCAVTAWGVPTVSLSWSASPEVDVAGYKIYIGTDSRDYFSTLDVGNGTTATIELPEYNKPYFFAATAYSASGLESDFSDEVSYIVTSGPTGGGSNTNPPAVYQSPTLSPISSVSINGTAGAQTVNFSGVMTGSGSSVTVTATSSNPSLIPNPAVNYTSPNSGGSLAFAPAANTSGTATITVTVNNGQPQNNLATQTFTVNVTKVYQSPTLNPIGGLSIAENSGLRTLGFTGVTTGSGSSVTGTATSSNPSLIPNPAVYYTSPNSGGSLAFTPVANASGTATITVRVNNGQPQNNLATQTFTVNVTPAATTPANQPPTLDAIPDLTLDYDSGAQSITLRGISSGAANENQPLIIEATSSNTEFIPNPVVDYTSPLATGILTINPRSQTSGSAVITVTVNDGAASNNIVSRSFTVTVKARSSGRTSGRTSGGTTGGSTGGTTPGSTTDDSLQFLTEPQSQVVLKGKTAKFTAKATASGRARLKYQWKLNGVNIRGGTRNTLTVQNCQASKAGIYTVTVTSAAGAITSQPVELLVSDTPASMLTSSVRTNGQFSFDVIGVPNYKYAVQCSTDMVHWTSCQTNAAPFTFTDTDTATVPGKFYRTVYVP